MVLLETLEKERKIQYTCSLVSHCSETSADLTTADLSIHVWHLAVANIVRLIVIILTQEEVGIGEDGSQETVALLEPNSSFGEISILCNIPQPYTVRVCELCRLIRIDKQSFSNILEIYFHDGKRILTNLLEVISLGQHAILHSYHLLLLSLLAVVQKLTRKVHLN